MKLQPQGNIMYTKFTAIICLALIALAPIKSEAAASYDGCTGFIDTIPASISAQGVWCLRHNLSTSIASGNAITVNTNNVTIDCNDFKIGGLDAGVNTDAVGIDANNRSNITVRNCNIRGFSAGIFLHGDGSGGGHLIENNRLNANTKMGVSVTGSRSIIRNNLITNTGDAFPGNGSTTAGILIHGSSDIIDNTISGIKAASGTNGWVIGISSGANMGGTIQNNRVRGLTKDGSGIAIGITSGSSSDRVVIRDNIVIGSGSDYIGIDCENNGRARDNLVSGFTNSLQCADAGGNDLTP